MGSGMVGAKLAAGTPAVEPPIGGLAYRQAGSRPGGSRPGGARPHGTRPAGTHRPVRQDPATA